MRENRHRQYYNETHCYNDQYITLSTASISSAVNDTTLSILSTADLTSLHSTLNKKKAQQIRRADRTRLVRRVE